MDKSSFALPAHLVAIGRKVAIPSVCARKGTENIVAATAVHPSYPEGLAGKADTRTSNQAFLKKESGMQREATQQVKEIAQSIGKNLRSKGVRVAHSQVLHAVSAAIGETDWHCLRSKEAEKRAETAPAAHLEPVIMELGQAPLTLGQLKAREWQVDVVVPVAVSQMSASIDVLNDLLSSAITGEAAMLEDIAFEAYSHPYGSSYVALRVTARVGEPEHWQELVSEAVTQADKENPEHWAFYVDRKVEATFQRQAWVNDYAVDTQPSEKVDVTREVLRHSLEKLCETKDHDYSTDYLVDPAALEHSGPFYVEAECAVMDFFEVEVLCAITQAMLDAARKAHHVTRFYS
ncbi:hypothetical protein F6X40_40440 [Paraburkholderia sp. UCT31]|uniref:hypothetical protein n=1 Tax=Paraburkholderia sp. UCT31 TaxID=2615209 RepID=UPI00165623B3|nr:hypothetical protein [Paraburkholderia sp. UCT31]MBC8742751.1 hypothetical protein [Paraburkholderia sp. UCT31]